MKLIIKVDKKKKCIYIFLNKNLFFFQKFLISNNKNISNTLYTLFYVYKIIGRFGLISPISKKFGY